MVKGYISFQEGKIPFVIDNYQMELFSDNDLVNDFCKHYNFKQNYVLHGQYHFSGTQAQNATFLVNYSLGTTCYLYGYIIDMIGSTGEYDSIGFQSPFLDDVFRYKYKYLDMVKDGINLGVEQIEVYKIPFSMNRREYELSYRIGQNYRMGLLEDFDKKGESILPMRTGEIQECYDLSVVLHRLAMFMTSHKTVPFKRIILYQNGHKQGWFYCPLVSNEAASAGDIMYFKLEVMHYIPKILNNIAMDSGNQIAKSVPLGHLGDLNDQFSPKRFTEQIMAFEYLFEKLDHKRAQNKAFPLKKELQSMLDRFPSIWSYSNKSSETIAEEIKELRRQLVHGYQYYYNFDSNLREKQLMILLDQLIQKMSLLLSGFSKEEIENYPII